MRQSRRGTQILSLEKRLGMEAKRLREEAEKIPPGPLKEAMLRKARQCETGARGSDWPDPSGQKPTRT